MILSLILLTCCIRENVEPKIQEQICNLCPQDDGILTNGIFVNFSNSYLINQDSLCVSGLLGVWDSSSYRTGAGYLGDGIPRFAEAFTVCNPKILGDLEKRKVISVSGYRHQTSDTTLQTLNILSYEVLERCGAPVDTLEGEFEMYGKWKIVEINIGDSTFYPPCEVEPYILDISKSSSDYDVELFPDLGGAKLNGDTLSEFRPYPSTSIKIPLTESASQFQKRKFKVFCLDNSTDTKLIIKLDNNFLRISNKETKNNIVFMKLIDESDVRL